MFYWWHCFIGNKCLNRNFPNSLAYLIFFRYPKFAYIIFRFKPACTPIYLHQYLYHPLILTCELSSNIIFCLFTLLFFHVYQYLILFLRPASIHLFPSLSEAVHISLPYSTNNWLIWELNDIKQSADDLLRCTQGEKQSKALRPSISLHLFFCSKASLTNLFSIGFVCQFHNCKCSVASSTSEYYSDINSFNIK